MPTGGSSDNEKSAMIADFVPFIYLNFKILFGLKSCSYDLNVLEKIILNKRAFFKGTQEGCGLPKSFGYLSGKRSHYRQLADGYDVEKFE